MVNFDMPCKRYYDAYGKGLVLEGHCPLAVDLLCLHPKVDYFPWFECQRYTINGDEKSPEQLKDELACLIKNRNVVWGD